MDIPKITRVAADLAFKVAGSVLTAAVLHIQPSAGTVPDEDAEDDGTDTYNVEGLLYQSIQQKNAEDSGYTATFLIRRKELSDAGLTEVPNDADYLMIGEVKWNIVRVDPDPSTAVYLIQIRRT